MKRLLACLSVVLCATTAHPEPDDKAAGPGALQALLAKVENGFRKTHQDDEQRLQQFKGQRSKQQELLQQALAIHSLGSYIS